MTDLYSLIGSDVSASPSPRMVNAAFHELGVDAVYTPVSVAPGSLPQTLRAMKLNNVKGFNVTIPFKCDIVPLLDSLSDIPQRIGAVNTAKLAPEGYEGFNTDVEGIAASLLAHGMRNFGAALVIGAGGAARAFCEAASTMGCHLIVTTARDEGRASNFVQAMGRVYQGTTFHSAPISGVSEEDVDVLFNASPIGSPGVPTPPQLRAALAGRPLVFDAVYRPRETQLLNWAKAEGCKTVNGHEMLLNQAAASVRIWTGLEPPSSRMNEALQASLGGVTN